jgi:RNA polymerase sigma-70 factor (ECF subfamily)
MSEAADQSTSTTLLGRLRQSPGRDPAAWQEFVRRYGRQVYEWCLRWGAQEADAEDVTQTVLLQMLERMNTFRYDPSGCFRGWLKTVAHNAWKRFLETRQRPGRGSGDSDVLDLLGTVEARDDLTARISDEFDRELLDEAMARVRLRVEAHTWEAFRLLALEGRSGAEVARQLGIKVATAFVARSRVQKMLHDEVGRLDALPEEAS